MDNSELIKQARELCGKATPGPWNVQNSSDVFTELGADNGNGAHAAKNDAWQVADCDAASGTDWDIDLDFDGSIAYGRLKTHANAAFIAASRSLVPQLCDALEAAEAENRWIPVSERLPEASEYRNGNRYKSMDSNELVPLLVCCEDTELPFRAFYDGKNWGDGWSKLEVICWMPLPSPM